MFDVSNDFGIMEPDVIRRYSHVLRQWWLYSFFFLPYLNITLFSDRSLIGFTDVMDISKFLFLISAVDIFLSFWQCEQGLFDRLDLGKVVVTFVIQVVGRKSFISEDSVA